MREKFLYVGHLRKPWVSIILLQLLALLLYLPVAWSDYLYTDEAIQLWHYRPGSDYHMFIEQGRYLTDCLVRFLFSRTDSIAGMHSVRLFSLACWLLAIPVWYLVLRRVFRQEGLPVAPVFLLVAWLVFSPTVGISVGWASCIGLALANTAGLLSGFFTYLLLMTDYSQRRWLVPVLALLSLLTGLVSLFTYQNGIGCFFLPFLVLVIAGRQPSSKTCYALLIAGLIAVVYFLLFNWQLSHYGIDGSSRARAVFSPVKKLGFFFARPFAAAWTFGVGYNESDRHYPLYVLPGLLFTGWLTFRYLRPQAGLRKGLAATAMLVVLCVAAYYPSLLVKENFASVRTTLGISVLVTCWFLVLLTRWLRDRPSGYRLFYVILFAFFAGNGFFNFRIRFLQAHVVEHREAVAAFSKGYDASANRFSWQMPAEDEFEKRYGLVRSWDEYAVPSLFFPWVPEFYFKQLLLERNGDRNLASGLEVRMIPAAPDDKP